MKTLKTNTSNNIEGPILIHKANGLHVMKYQERFLKEHLKKLEQLKDKIKQIE
ncbi:MAG: hypothetical protein AAF901_08225 [Bacteroidota bacterium]